MPLTLENVTVQSGSPRHQILLSNITGQFHEGRITLVVGPSGAGKSTLLQTMAGLNAPSAGFVKIDGVSLYRHGRTIREALLQVGYMGQFPEEQLFATSILKEVRYSLRGVGLPSRLRTLVAARWLRALDVSEATWFESPLVQSGGQKRRIALASTIATDARWLLFDEPTAGLDADGRRQFRQLLSNLASDTRGIIIATHDLDELLPVAESVWLMQSGRQLTECKSEELYAHPELLTQVGVGIPDSVHIIHQLRTAGIHVQSPSADDIATALLQAMSDQERHPSQHSLGNVSPLLQRPDGGLATTCSVDESCHHQTQTRPHVENLQAHGDSRQAYAWIASFHPVARWLFFTCLTVALFLQNRWVGVATMAGLVLALTIATGISLKKVLTPLRPFLWIAFASIVLSATSWSRGNSLRSAGQLHATAAPLATSVGVMHLGHITLHLQMAAATLQGTITFVIAMAIGVLLPAVITPLELTTSLEKVLGGLRRYHIPVSAMILAMTLILRFLPLFMREVERFSKVAQSRGKAAGRPGKLQLRSLPSAAIPLLLSVLRLGEDYSIALEARGVQGFDGVLTTQNAERWKALDWAPVLMGILLILGLWHLRK